MKDQIYEAARKLKTWSAVAVVGAGASVEPGYPLTMDLPALVWDTLDRCPNVLAQLKAAHPWSGTTSKEVIGVDEDRLDAAWKAIEADPSARLAYQGRFALLDQEKRELYSPAHTALARLMHSGRIDLVVSLNWDSLLETAYEREYGIKLRAGGPELYKPHGDVFDLKADWILPHQAGYIPDEILDHIRELDQTGPHVLLIIGFSERDKEVVARLTKPLKSRWPTIYITPRRIDVVEGDLALPSGARSALPSIVEEIGIEPELPGWEYVTFHNQHPDLQAALEGRGLTAADVRACPRLPEVTLVTGQLLSVGSAHVVGVSGSGKSITAYQAAYEMNQLGWEVVRLELPGRLTSEQLAVVTQNLRHPRMALVDDAHLLEPRQLRKLVESTSDRFTLLSVATRDIVLELDSEVEDKPLAYLVPARETIEVGGQRAVRTIAAALLRNRSNTLELVQKLDNHVGEGYLDTSLEDRMAEATDSDLPWTFMLILTGGERRVHEQLGLLRDKKRADLALAAIATGQRATRDNGVSRVWLERATALLDRDPTWLDRSLLLLEDHRLTQGKDLIRCPHVRIAHQILRLVYADNKDPKWQHLVNMLRFIVLDHNLPLDGVASLLFDLWFADGFRFSPADTLIDADTFGVLAERSWLSDKADGAVPGIWMLRVLLRWQPELAVLDVRSHLDKITMWVQEAKTYTANDLNWLLNDLHQQAPDLVATISAKVDPVPIATYFEETGWVERGTMAGVLVHLLMSADDEWKERFRKSLNMDALTLAAEEMQDEDLWGFAQMTKTLIALDRELSLDLVEAGIPSMAKALNSSPVSTVPVLIWEIIHGALWCAHPFADLNPSPRQRNLARRLGRMIDPATIAKALSASQWRDWENYTQLLEFLREAEPRRLDSIASLTDLRQLDKVAEPLWQVLPRDFLNLLMKLARGPEMEPARSWITRNIRKIDKMVPTIVVIAPEAAIGALRTGKTMDLGLQHGLEWARALLPLYELYQIDPEVAKQVVQDNYDSIAVGLTFSMTNPNCEHFPAFLKVITAVDADVLQEVFSRLDAATVEKRWAELLKGNKSQRQAIASLFYYASSSTVPQAIRDIINRLTQRYPRASRYMPRE